MAATTGTVAPSSAAARRSAPSSPARSSSGGSPTSRGAAASASPSTPSFFIIQEPNHEAAVHATPLSLDKPKSEQHVTPSASTLRGDLDRQRNALVSRQSLQPAHSLNSGSAGPRRDRRQRTATQDAAVLHEETDDDLRVDGEDRDDASITRATSQHRVLSILNRIGSSPDLPLSNAWSAAVFSSSKKRQLMKPTNGTGASPQLAAIQRSRLIPLPINIRTGTLKKREDTDHNSHSSALGACSSSLGSLCETLPSSGHPRKPDVEEERLNYEISISSLKQRVSYLEKELAKAMKHRHVVESQLDAMTKEIHAVHNEKTQLMKKLDDYEKTNLHQRHAFDKLSQRYAIVYENLAKLSDAATLASTAQGGDGNPTNVVAVHLVIQTLTKENQELQRKVRVLETRHADDKLIVGNQEKQIKRLRAEMEALQHMAGTKEDAAGSNSSAIKPLPEMTNANRSAVSRADSSHSVVAPVMLSANPTLLQGIVVSDEYAYIDPNILKVLEKVDSQFSITNAISLSAMLKKWLHSCLHVVASTDIHAVLHVLLKRVCELMHCQHAAIFHVDHGSKKLLGLVSERGHVRWELPLDKGILGHAARQNVLCNVRKAYDDPRFFSASDTITATKSREVLCIPLTRELDHFQPEQVTALANNSVFAVLQCWNTTTQKPFSHNDQILGGLLGIQAGIVLSQTKLTDNLTRIHNRVLQIVHMNEELAAKAAARALPQDLSDAMTAVSGSSTAVSIVHLVRAAQRKFAEIVGVTKLRIFILDAETQRIWFAGAQLDATGSSGSAVHTVPIRKYANVASSLCTLALPSHGSTHHDETDSLASHGCRIVLDPTAEPSFNDTVDLKGGANGLYLAPIRSPWQELPLGMMQVARTGSALQSSTSSSIDSQPITAAVRQERAHAQHVDDMLTMELIQLFCQQFAGLLHHALALQLHELCPEEVHQARLSYLTDHLDLLEREYQREQEEAEAEAEMLAKQTMANVRLEQRLLSSVQQGQRDEAPAVTTPRSSRTLRPSSALTARQQGEDHGPLEPVPLISTDSSYAIDVSELGGSSSASPDGVGESSEGGSSTQDGEEYSGGSGSALSLLSSPRSF